MATENNFRALKEDERALWREVYVTALGGLIAAQVGDMADPGVMGEAAEAHAWEAIRRMRGER